MNRKKDVSILVSAFCMLMGIITALVAAVKKKGGTEEDFYRLATSEGENLIEKIADLIVQAGRKAANIFIVSVNYDLPLKDSIKAGKYGWENDNITSEYFPSSESGTAEITIELFHFDQDITTDQVLAELDRQGYRPATLKELLALGEKFPDLQRNFPIIALGSVWRDLFGRRNCPYLGRDGSERSLGLSRVSGGWVGVCRFAAVRKGV